MRHRKRDRQEQTELAGRPARSSVPRTASQAGVRRGGAVLERAALARSSVRLINPRSSVAHRSRSKPSRAHVAS
eukprot:9226977-Alexandrium_andersonii.AAC.1